jgi:isoleucyl-tRNA synthetase
LVDDLTNWYIRRSRRRFWKSETDNDKRAAYSTLYAVLTSLSKLLAPFTPFLAEAIWQNLASKSSDDHFSVHHQTYPMTRVLSDDEYALLSEVAIARTTVNLGHSLRSQSKVKVRQPLNKIIVVANDHSKSAILNQTEVICDELNVKGIEFAEREVDLVTYKIMPDLKKLGKKLGANLPKVREAVESLDATVIALQVKQGKPVDINLDGVLPLQADELIVQAVPKAGLLVEGSDGIVVALDPVLTESLIYEGLSREVVRRINDQRKTMNLALSDRIEVSYNASHRLNQAIVTFNEFICSETLTMQLSDNKLLTEHAVNDEFDNEKLSFVITKA